MTRLASLILGLTLAACGSQSDEFERVADAISAPLSLEPGDAARGGELFSAREGGHCVLCHQVDGLGTPFQGDLGPALTGIGSRLSEGQLRLRLVDYQQVRPGAVMPSYFQTEDLYQVGTDYLDQTILSAQDIEDLTAYLSGLKE